MNFISSLPTIEHLTCNPANSPTLSYDSTHKLQLSTGRTILAVHTGESPNIAAINQIPANVKKNGTPNNNTDLRARTSMYLCMEFYVSRELTANDCSRDIEF